MSVVKRPASVINCAFEGTGCFPQAQTLGKGYDSDAPSSVYRLPRDGFPDFEPSFGVVTLERKAILTDVISCPALSTSKGLIVSARMRMVLDGFPLQPHRYYALPVEQRGESVGSYFWLHLPEVDPKIDASASKAEAEGLVEGVVPNVELIQLPRPARYSGLYVGADLKAALDAARITGIRYSFARLFR